MSPPYGWAGRVAQISKNYCPGKELRHILEVFYKVYREPYKNPYGREVGGRGSPAYGGHSNRRYSEAASTHWRSLKGWGRRGSPRFSGA